MSCWARSPDRAAASHSVRREESPEPWRHVAIHSVIVAGLGIPEIAGELFRAVARRRNLPAVGKELADRLKAIRVHPASPVLDQLAAKVIINFRLRRVEYRLRHQAGDTRQSVVAQLLSAHAVEGDRVGAPRPGTIAPGPGSPPDSLVARCVAVVN